MKSVSDIVQVKGCVAVVPAENLERRQVGFLSILREVGETDLPLRPLAIVGDEQQVVRLPRPLAQRCWRKRVSSSTTRLRIRRRATTGSRFGSNLTKKMPQGWLGGEAGAAA